ncbi:double-stranded RNA-binding protein 6-like isoform X2 [Mangifera indica]|uniref:double-stranded RNA-binding protein 6-like isoform X2 n=1 Tax=Mangifera indica TaxID=29780 RepID=UPI001CFB1800|nr:double-stranded RNA-binding protein 6-like isoform X2 [Mangifera indica]
MSKGLPELVMYKNRLQEYTQKLGLPLPEYLIRNEGFQHAPKFRARVLVNGKSYVSVGTFPQRKEAEQDAAKVALQSINEARNDGGCPNVQDPTYCKMILFEYAVKMNLKRPEYSTTGGEQIRPVFMSTLIFDGKVYQSEEARSKKIAEQLAARVAIQSLLGILQQIINSKYKAQDSVYEAKNPRSNQSNLPAPSAPVASSRMANYISPSTSKLESVSPTCNCSSETKRKPQTSNQTQKKLRRHLQ